MKVNNIEFLHNFLDFTNEHTCYRIQIIKRRKDAGNEEMKTGEKLIRFYYIFSMADYDKLIGKIIDQCETKNARAYLEINPKSYVAVAKKLMVILAQYAEQNNYRTYEGAYHKAYGQCNSLFKKFILDVYELNNEKLRLDLIQILYDNRKLYCKNEGSALIINNTLNGYHIIFDPVRMDKLYDSLREFGFNDKDVKKNGMTLLYF